MGTKVQVLVICREGIGVVFGLDFICPSCVRRVNQSPRFGVQFLFGDE